jgi:hypothetical protein
MLPSGFNIIRKKIAGILPIGKRSYVVALAQGK